MSCRFVQPKVTRLSLADVSRKALKDLEAKPKPKATADELAAAQRRIQENDADGLWIDVKNELTAGEHRSIFDRMVKTLNIGEKAELDPKQVGLAKMVEYIIGWNFTDGTGQQVAFSEASVSNLDIQTFNEIAEAINAHEAVLEAQRAERKNVQIGSPESGVT